LFHGGGLRRHAAGEDEEGDKPETAQAHATSHSARRRGAR
jgi:hypothetical protein